jgi:hypothetical protein
MPKIFSGANRLRDVPARTIVNAVADAAERWYDADFPLRVRATAAIEARLGYTEPVVDYALDRLFAGITRDTLGAAIADELGSLDALDGFVERPGRPAAWARGVERAAIVSSDTTIGVAIAPLAFALCAKCCVTVKDRSDALVAAFAETLAEELPPIAHALDVHAWPGGDADFEEAAFGSAGTVVAFGGADALRAIRARCAPGATFVPFGHRASAGYVARDAGAAEAAAGVARDSLLYDGDGCLSLHLLFVEGDALAFARELARACAATTIEFPPGTRGPGRAAFRAANGDGAVLRAPDGAWTIVVDPPRTDVPTFGGGVIPVLTVTGIDDAGDYVAAHNIPLQALGIAGSVDVRRAAERLGAVRIAPAGTLQDPPAAGHHGGRARIADFVRWVDRA